MSHCSSRDSAGAKSFTELLTVGPRLTGVPHGQLASAQARRDTQMFWSKTPSSGRSGRVEAKNMVSPSLDSAACWSLNDVLIVGPRFTGSDQAENCGALSAASDAR